ncbi:ABC transporter permease subunit [Methylovirgula sp. 4M-Z18]|nr:ABC transporter permease subunit [Methylovirgula sp. 4M-Z18]
MTSIYTILASGWGVFLLWGVVNTLAVTVVSMLIGAVFGALVAAAKISHKPWLKWVGEIYTTIFRGEPELLIVYLFYFGGTQILTGIGRSTDAIGPSDIINMPSFIGGVLAIGLISGAYQAEVYRGAYYAILKGEIEAARAYGMSTFTLFRRIIVPQVMRFAIPGLGNVWQLTIKDSALISVTGFAELMLKANTASRSSHKFLLFYSLAGALFLVLTSISTPLFNRAERYATRSTVRPK